MEKTLEEICEKIDSAYKETAELQLQVAAKSREISDAKNEIHDIKQRMRLFIEKFEDVTFLDSEGEPEEVQQLLASKKDEITHLLMASADSDESVRMSVAELDAQCDKEMELITNLSKTSRDVYIAEIHNLLKRRKKEELLETLKATDLSVREVEARKNRVENRLVEVISKLGKSTNEPGGIVDLTNAIKNVKTEIEGVESQIEEMIDKICKSRDLDEKQIQEHQEHVDHLTSLYGFSGTKAEYQEEINKAKQQVAENSRELCIIEEQIKAKERRLHVLKSLKRTSMNANVEVPDECSADDLIAELKDLRSRCSEADEEVITEHNQIAMKNIELQERIERGRRSLEIMLTRFQTERDELAQKIQRARLEATQKEQEMLQSLNELKKRRNAATPNAKSSIAAPTKRAIPGSALKVIDRPEVIRDPAEKITLSIKRPLNC